MLKPFVAGALTVLAIETMAVVVACETWRAASTMLQLQIDPPPPGQPVAVEEPPLLGEPISSSVGPMPDATTSVPEVTR